MPICSTHVNKPVVSRRTLLWLPAVLIALALSLPAMAQQFAPPLKRPNTNAPKTVEIDDQTQKTKVMNVAVHTWEPWAGSNLTSMGLLPRLVSEILSQDGTQTRFRFMHWSKALDMLANKEVDAAIIWISADLRLDPFVISDPLMRERAALYSLKGNTYSKSLEAIPKGRLAWRHDYVYEYDIYNKLESKAFTPVPVASEAEGLQAVLAKKADFFIAPYGPGRDAVAKLDATDKNAIAYVMLENNFPRAFFLMNAETDNAKKRIELFNTALRRMQQNGSYKKIFADSP